MKALNISAKDLGQLEMDGFCQRCFFIKMGVDRRLPFQSFPGIFASLDGLNKKMVEKYFDDYGCAPPCFEGIPKCVGYEKAKMIAVQDKTTGIHVRGEPDAIFKLQGGKTAIIDYKTARYTKGQDRLLPIYNVQLNVYNYLRIQSGKAAVDKLYLIYMEPQTYREDGEYQEYLTDVGFHLDFAARVVELELQDEDYVPGLLQRLKKLCLLESIPAGAENCWDCKLLDLLVGVLDEEASNLEAVEASDMLTLASIADLNVGDAINSIRRLAKRRAVQPSTLWSN